MVGVAQLVEHLVVVQVVAGSSPVTHPAGSRRLVRTERLVAFRTRRAVGRSTAPLAQSAEQLTLNQRVVGSSPTRRTGFCSSQPCALAEETPRRDPTTGL